MEQYIMRGGNPLVGEVTIGGAKNAALGLLAAAIMADNAVHLENLPDVSDIRNLIASIEGIGATVTHCSASDVKIDGSTVNTLVVDNAAVRKMRASYYLLGAMLGRFRHAEVALPGGCAIGSRPIDQHIKGFRALGAEVIIENGMVICHADKLRGAHIYLDVVSVGATINVMMAACMAEGKTTLENVAKEPHVVDVANLLNCMGADIRGAGTDVIRIRGVQKLHGCEYSVIPDQIEAGTFMFAAAITQGDVVVRNVIPKHLESITSKLREMGCEVTEFDESVRVTGKPFMNHTDVKTLPYPGFPTDMQPQIAATLALARGTSVIRESIFENRFKYVDELNRMGANIKVESGSIAIVDGVSRLSGAAVKAPDLRAGAALVLAGLAAEGLTTVEDIHFIDRGYENFLEKLQGLGADIARVNTDHDAQKFKLQVV